MRRLLTVAVSAAIALTVLAPQSSVLSAQRLGPLEKRPKLRDFPDTNDAQAYFEAGVQEFRHDPQTAAAAFYWAARLNPGWGDPLYGRRAALLAQNRNLLDAAMSDSRRSRSKDLRRLDSLQARALMLNPFLYRRLDRQLFMTWLSDGDRAAEVELNFEISKYMMQASEFTQGWYAYCLGRFDSALDHYAKALEHPRDAAATLHLERARIFGMRNAVDSAADEFRAALDDLRKKDQKDLVIFYDSKAQAEFSTAVLYEGAGMTRAAREAYGRALQEDLAYYPAHMRLGLLALSEKDTATAASELALAAQIAPDEPFIRYMNGYVLGLAKRPAEAVAELKKSIELEPYYALPNLVLGNQYETLEKAPDAIAAYERFLALASLHDPQRDFAKSRVDDLKEFLKAPGAK